MAALPARHRHIVRIQFDTHIPFLSRDIERWLEGEIASAVGMTSPESPLRDVQNVIVERVAAQPLKEA